MYHEKQSDAIVLLLLIPMLFNSKMFNPPPATISSMCDLKKIFLTLFKLLNIQWQLNWNGICERKRIQRIGVQGTPLPLKFFFSNLQSNIIKNMPRNFCKFNTPSIPRKKHLKLIRAVGGFIQRSCSYRLDFTHPQTCILK